MCGTAIVRLSKAAVFMMHPPFGRRCAISYFVFFFTLLADQGGVGIDMHTLAEEWTNGSTVELVLSTGECSGETYARSVTYEVGTNLMINGLIDSLAIHSHEVGGVCCDVSDDKYIKICCRRQNFAIAATINQPWVTTIARVHDRSWNARRMTRSRRHSTCSTATVCWACATSWAAGCRWRPRRGFTVSSRFSRPRSVAVAVLMTSQRR